jgi:argininosuccinate synthase
LTAIRPTDRIVLACSGDLVTSLAIPWLADRFGAEIVTVTLDLGQPAGLEDLRERALAAGAVRAHVIDARDEFARDFILPALQAGVLDSEGDRCDVALARLLVARHLVAVAALENAVAVAHGIDVATDGRSFAGAVRSLNPRLRVLSPAREWRMTRAAISSNLWIQSARRRAGVNPSPRTDGPPRSAADNGASVAIRFDRGLPVAINDVELPLVDLIGSLTTIGGAHGIGSLNGDAMSAANDAAIEAPAAAVLRAACRDLRAAALPATKIRMLRDVAASSAQLIAQGRWFTPARETLDALLSTARDHLTGTVRLELVDGACHVVDCDVPERPGEGAARDEFVPEAPRQPIASAQA